MNQQTKQERQEAFQKEAVEGTQFHFFRQNGKWGVRFCYPEIAWANAKAQICEIKLTDKESQMIKYLLGLIARREALKSESDINNLQ